MKKTWIVSFALLFCFVIQSTAIVQAEWREINRAWVEVPMPLGDFEKAELYSSTPYASNINMKLSKFNGFGYNSTSPLFQDSLAYYSSGIVSGFDYNQYPQNYSVVTEEIQNENGELTQNKCLLFSAPVTKIGTATSALNTYLPKIYLDTGASDVVTDSRRYKISFDYKFNGASKDANGVNWGTAATTLGFRSYGITGSQSLQTLTPTANNGTTYTNVEAIADASKLPIGVTYFAWYIAAGSGTSADKLYIDNFKTYVEGTTKISNIYFASFEEMDMDNRLTKLSESLRNSTIYAKIDIKDEIKSKDKPIILVAGIYRKDNKNLADGKYSSELIGLNAASNIPTVNTYLENRSAALENNIIKVDRLDYSLSIPLDLSKIPNADNLSNYEVRAYIWNGFSTLTNIGVSTLITGE